MAWPTCSSATTWPSCAPWPTASWCCAPARVVEEGEADAVFAAPRDSYTAALMAAAFPDKVLSPA